MSKEKQIQEYESKQLIDELSKMPPKVIATAYLHAINYTLYGLHQPLYKQKRSKLNE